MMSIESSKVTRRICIKNMKLKISNLLILLITKCYFLRRRAQWKNKTIEPTIWEILSKRNCLILRKMDLNYNLKIKIFVQKTNSSQSKSNLNQTVINLCWDRFTELQNNKFKRWKIKIQKSSKENRVSFKWKGIRVSETLLKFWKLKRNKLIWGDIEVIQFFKRPQFVQTVRTEEKTAAN